MSKIRCPKCRSTNTVSIIYGLLRFDEDQFEEEIKNKTNDFYPGGCVTSYYDPDRHCNDCNINFDMHPLNIYLNIEGILLTDDLTPAISAKKFLEIILGIYPFTTYWLTDDTELAIQRIGHHFDSETVELMKKIKPASWAKAKTDAIDFTKPFYWLDNKVSSKEERTLFEHGVLQYLVKIDLAKDPDKLDKIVSELPFFHHAILPSL